MTEWLGGALQKLLFQFKSERDLFIIKRISVFIRIYPNECLLLECKKNQKKSNTTTMNRNQITELDQLNTELVTAEQELLNVEKPSRLSQEDIEDVSDNYQSHLEYNWWLNEHKSLIEHLKLEIIKLRTTMNFDTLKLYDEWYKLPEDKFQEFTNE